MWLCVEIEGADRESTVVTSTFESAVVKKIR